MKALKQSFLLLSLSLVFSSTGFSQQYTLRDQQEIAYQARLTLNLYKDLLNVLSYKDLATESEIKELIRNSYSPSGSQLFYSEAAIIEDNIRPSNLLSGQAQDKTIHDYLSYFDLAYEKSDQETIEFYAIEASGLKYSSYLYLQLKYTCLFKGEHKEDNTPYRAVERLAEFRVEKQGNKWKTYISSIVYYDPANPINSPEGNVKLDRTVADKGTFSYLTEQLNKEGEGLIGEATQAEIPAEESRAQDSLFTHFLETGNAALTAGQLPEAFAAFSEAEKIRPSHQELRRSLMELTKAQSLQISSVEKRFEYAKLQADKAFAARDFVTAKRRYTEALRLKPEREELKGIIEELGRAIQKKAVLESRFAVGEYEEAIKGYTKAIKEERDNPDYYYGRGRCYERLNRVEEALEDFSKAIALDGDFMQALSSRARLHAKAGQFHQAVADYTLLLADPDYAAAAYAERARIKQHMGDSEGAIRDLDAAIRQSPEVADYPFEKGLLLISRKNPTAAIPAFSRAIEKDGQHAGAFCQRGLAYATLDDLRAASADFERARQLGLSDVQLAEINKLTAKYYSRAEGAMAEERYQQALKSFTDALLVSPAFGRAWLRKGDAYFMLENYDSAIANYNQAVAHEEMSFAYFRRGLAYQQMNEEQSASQDFARYIPIGKELVARTKEENAGRPAASLQLNFIEDRADAFYALGYAQLMRLQFVEALENLDMAIHNRKFFPKAYFARGAALYALEEYRGAVKNMEESIRMGMSEPLVFYSLGQAYVANRQLEDAVYSYSHTLKLDPQYEAAYRERALCYKSLGEYALALKDMEAAIALNEALTKDANFLTHKGLLELTQDKPGEARQSLDNALQLDATNGWALYGKACVLAGEEKTEESLELYRKAFLTGQIEWEAIRNDPLIHPVSKHKAFKQLVKTYL